MLGSATPAQGQGGFASWPRASQSPEADVKEKRFAEPVVPGDHVHSRSELGVQWTDWTNAFDCDGFEHGGWLVTTRVMARTGAVYGVGRTLFGLRRAENVAAQITHPDHGIFAKAAGGEK